MEKNEGVNVVEFNLVEASSVPSVDLLTYSDWIDLALEGLMLSSPRWNYLYITINEDQKEEWLPSGSFTDGNARARLQELFFRF